MLTRRCTQRMFFFVPGGKTEALFEYALACAAKFAGVKIIGWCLMSNHYHILVYDPHGTLAMFLHHLNMQLARSFKAYLGRGENLFASDSLSRVELVKVEDVVDKLAYTLANPVQAGLVGTASAWGGSTSWHIMMRGARLRVPRPKIYHRTCRDKFGELTLYLEDKLLGQREVFVAHVKAKVRAIELEVETKRRANDEKVMGWRPYGRKNQRRCQNAGTRCGGCGRRLRAKANGLALRRCRPTKSSLRSTALRKRGCWRAQSVIFRAAPSRCGS